MKAIATDTGNAAASAAIERVLEAERHASEAVASCEREASAIVDEALDDDEMKVTVVATGFGGEGRRPEPRTVRPMVFEKEEPKENPNLWQNQKRKIQRLYCSVSMGVSSMNFFLKIISTMYGE